jgi:hypothetical protein
VAVVMGKIEMTKGFTGTFLSKVPPPGQASSVHHAS